ncbi:hypothetical protein ASE48_10850 [Mycobacterium sp. Root265]|uniref:hypothetical protein n=1 Tax=Mycobacterium sp. Root265 TaxID=1736504 RepID=UPI00070D482E|nr:hypothetical protein [Mycobacterium sp. Root265]KRD07902.1 hypothetical protein ASE48_10850 [Mycobacterium sp. Root265]
MCAAPARHRVARSGAPRDGRQWWLAKDLLAESESTAAVRHARKNPANHALNVGRVGALAVSLGVGFAIASTAQPAYADTETGSSASSESSSSSDAADSDKPSASADDSSDSRPTITRKRAPKTATKPSATAITEEPAEDPELSEPIEEPASAPTRKARAHIPLDRPLEVQKAVTAVLQASPDPETETVTPVAADTAQAASEAPVIEVPQAPAIEDTKPTVGAVTPKMTAASATLGTQSATTPNPLDLLVNTMMAWVARQISHTFVNRTPVAGPIVYEQNALGQVYIDLNATDPNGDVLSYEIIQPEKGWVYRDLISGKFVYTPWALVTGQPLVDSFKIVVHDDSEHLPGVLGQIQTLVENVTRFLGIAQADNLTVTIPVTVDPVYQNPPLVTPIIGGGYTIGKEPAHIVSTVDIVDGDSIGLKRVVIKVATLAQVGDVLTYNAPVDSPIVGSWDPATLTLTLSGSGTLAQYEEAIKAVTFSATQGALLVRGISISATDEEDVDNIAPGFVTVSVWPATKLPPLVTPIAGGGFTLGGNPAKVVSAVDIVDGDSGKLSKLTVKIATLAQSGDILNYVAPSGNPVVGTWNAAERTLTLSGDATIAQYEEALKAVTFSATGGALLVRGLSISATDEDGVDNIAPGFVTVGVGAAPTLPPLVTPIAGGGFTLGGNPAKVVSAVDIVDGDSGKLSKLTVKIVTFAQSGDVLNYVAPSGNPVTATWNPADFTLTLTGAGTLAQYEEALKAVTFTATQGAALVRGLSISATDEHSIANIAPGFVTLGVSSPTRYVPLVTPIGGRSYTIGDSPMKPVASVSIVDADSSHLQKVTVSVTTFGKSGDTLIFAGLSGNPVTAVYDAGTRTLTLTGIATKQQYEDALKAVTFTATQGGWTTRTILIVATDTDGVSSAPGSLTLSVW